MLATRLFAEARGYDVASGSHRCFYCLSRCGDEFFAAQYVKRSFTGRDTVGGGDYVCGGCVAAMDEKAAVTLPDGTVRAGQKIRSYSWMVTRRNAIAASKSHRPYLRDACLCPPEPPFAIVLSDSGQKHLIYRGKVCHSRDVVTVTLEGEPVTYRHGELKDRMALCNKVVAVLGRPGMAEAPRPLALVRLEEYHGDADVPRLWMSVREEPLTRLAAWLSLSKKEAEIEYPNRSTCVG